MIYIPRHIKTPVDAYQYSIAMRNQHQYKSKLQVIRKVITDVMGIDPYFDSDYQGAEYVKSRQLFFYFVRKYEKLSFYATGQLLGKDHATVIHAEKCVEKYKGQELEYHEKFEAIEKRIKQQIK
jgi:chromosomal replication initiation ATPase DnaA